MSPTGDRVYVTMQNQDSEKLPRVEFNYATVAFDSGGDVVWVARLHGSAGNAGPAGVAVSPDGAAVYVTGTTFDEVGDDIVGHATTVAYDTRTGNQLWISRHPDAHAGALAVSPDGRRLYVTGYQLAKDPDLDNVIDTDSLTIAYDAASGATLWDAVAGTPSTWDGSITVKLTVSPAGDRVFVSGTAQNQSSGTVGFFTLAYDVSDLASDEPLWVSRRDPTAREVGLALTDMNVSPDGSKVFLAGFVVSLATKAPVAPALAIAYDARTGEPLWEKQYSLNRLSAFSTTKPVVGVSDFYVFNALTPSPDGKRVYATGTMLGDRPTFDFDGLTVAYDADTGEQLWAKRYDWADADGLYDVASSPDGRLVYVTGSSTRYGVTAQSGTFSPPQTEGLVIAYDADTGEQISTARRGHIDTFTVFGHSLGVSPDSERVYVVGALSYNPVTSGTLAEKLGMPMNANGNDMLFMIYDTSPAAATPAPLSEIG